MTDDKFKLLFNAIQRNLRTDSVYFELAAVKFDEGYLAVQFVRCDPQALIDSIKLVLGAHSELKWDIKAPSSGTVKLLVEPIGPIAMGIPFSSPDEARGTEPIELAQLFVRSEITKSDPAIRDNDYTTYLPFFAYILGGWKATVSTSMPDGRYYEVTYNKEADEFYVDTYIKLKNSVYNNAQEASE